MNNNSIKDLNNFFDKSTQDQYKYHKINNQYQLIIGSCLIILAFILIGILAVLTDSLALQQAIIAIAVLLIIAALNIFKSVREYNKTDSSIPSIKLDNRTFIYGDYNLYNSGDQISHETSNHNQIVVETVAEIQKLLNQSSEAHPVETTQEKMVIAAEVVDEIENNPSLKQRVTSAIKLGGIAALGSTLVHPAAGITVAALAGWLAEQESEESEPNIKITKIEKG